MIVGQAPGRGGDAPLFPSASGSRLLALSGLDLPTFRQRFEVMNLLERWPGPSPSGRGDAFQRVEAREAAERLRPILAHRPAILLGRGVARALGVHPETPFLGWVVLKDGLRVAVLPHPSGTSTFWNSTTRTALAAAFLKRASRGVLV